MKRFILLLVVAMVATLASCSKESEPTTDDVQIDQSQLKTQIIMKVRDAGTNFKNYILVDSVTNIYESGDSVMFDVRTHKTIYGTELADVNPDDVAVGVIEY